MRADTLTLIDLVALRWRLLVEVSRVPRRPALSATLTRCPVTCGPFLRAWRWRAEDGQ